MLIHLHLGSDDLDVLQIFLPWSWSNLHPNPILSPPHKTYNPNYFPYNKYIFQRAQLTEEEREDTECLCYHFTPPPPHRLPDTWFDWPCGCKKPLLDLRSRQFAFYELELLTSDDHHFSLHPHLAFIIAPLDSDPAEGLVRFTVPYRSTKFPSKSSRKRRNTFGRALSLTDRKHYKMGRSNAKT